MLLFSGACLSAPIEVVVSSSPGGPDDNISRSIFQYVGEDETKIGDESRSYLGEHIFKQVFAIYATEDDTRESARKRNRKTSSETNQAVVGALLQMAIDDNGSTRSNSNTKSKTPLRGTKNGGRKTVPKTSARIRRT